MHACIQGLNAAILNYWSSNFTSSFSLITSSLRVYKMNHPWYCGECTFDLSHLYLKAVIVQNCGKHRPYLRSCCYFLCFLCLSLTMPGSSQRPNPRPPQPATELLPHPLPVHKVRPWRGSPAHREARRGGDLRVHVVLQLPVRHLRLPVPCNSTTATTPGACNSMFTRPGSTTTVPAPGACNSIVHIQVTGHHLHHQLHPRHHGNG
jgi:hypothetical protein